MSGAIAMVGIVVDAGGSGGGGGGGSGGLTLSVPSVGRIRSGAGSVTTPSVTATATFGTGPYTYAWTKADGDTFTIGSPSSATTYFSAYLSNGDQLSGTYQCAATDSLSVTQTALVGVYGLSTETNDGNLR